MFVDVLPRWERYTYWVCSLSSLAYCVFSVFQEGERHKDRYLDDGLLTGWSWIGRPKDNTHLGWFIWMNTVWTALSWNVIHVMLSQACRFCQANGQIRQLLLTMASLCFLCSVYGIRIVTILLVIATIMYLLSLQDRLRLIWLLAIALMFSRFLDFVDKFEAQYLLLEDILMYTQFHISVSTFCIKIISFGLEKRKYRDQQTNTKKTDRESSGQTFASSGTSKNKSTHSMNSVNEINAEMDIVESDPTFLDSLFYLFYYPTFFWGPFYEYCHFHNQVKSSFKTLILTESFYDVTKQLIKIVFFMFFIELHAHFLYYTRIGYDEELLESVSDWTFYGIIYCHSCYFHTKYFITYGFGIQLSRLDGIAPVSAPRCIHFSYSGADLWKSFDEGIYIFLKKCIFIPLGGSRRGVLRQLLISGLCFVFMIFWHGAGKKIIIWGVVNYFTCVLEIAGSRLSKSDFGVRVKSHLSPAMILRLKALLHYPVYMMLLLTGYYFFFTRHVGWIAFSKMTFQ
ncbi:unnamed protein product, partial [Candidula unifasciata]